MLLSLRSQARAAAIQKSRWIELLQAKKMYMLCENFIYTGRAHVPGARGAQGSRDSGLAGLRARGTQGLRDSGLAGLRARRVQACGTCFTLGPPDSICVGVCPAPGTCFTLSWYGFR